VRLNSSEYICDLPPYLYIHGTFIRAFILFPLSSFAQKFKSTGVMRPGELEMQAQILLAAEFNTLAQLSD
jgi:hypothetical protein